MRRGVRLPSGPAITCRLVIDCFTLASYASLSAQVLRGVSLSVTEGDEKVVKYETEAAVKVGMLAKCPQIQMPQRAKNGTMMKATTGP